MRWPNNHHRTLEVAQWRQARLWQTISTPPCNLVEVPKTLQTQKRKKPSQTHWKMFFSRLHMQATRCLPLHGDRLFYHTWFSSLMTWGAVVSSFMPCPRHWLCAPALLSRSVWSISCAIWSMKQLLIHTATRKFGWGQSHVPVYWELLSLLERQEKQWPCFNSCGVSRIMNQMMMMICGVSRIIKQTIRMWRRRNRRKNVLETQSLPLL